MQYLTAYLGDSPTLTIPLAWQGVAFAPGNDWGLIWTCKACVSDEDAAAIIQKASGVGITAPATSALVALVRADTVDLEAAKLVWDVQAQHATTGEVRTVATGILTLSRDVTREVQTSVDIITTEEPAPFGGGGSWGGITGDLEDQTDLAAALDAKVDNSQLSISGGANKVLQLDSAGNLRLGAAAPEAGISWMTNSLVMRDGDGGISRIWWLNENGSDGASMFYNQEHSGAAELQINGPRVALCDGYHGVLQFGLQRGWDSKQYVFFQARGSADASHTGVDGRPVYLAASYWNGSITTGTKATGFQGKVVAGGAADTYMSFFADATVPNEGGGDGSRTEVAALYKTGLRLTVQDTTNTDAAVSRAYGDTRWKPLFSFQAADKTFTQSTTVLQDTDISVTLAAATTYKIETFAYYTVANASHGIQHKLTYSGSMTAKGGIATTGNAGVLNGNPISGTSGAEGYHNPFYLYNGGNLFPLVHTVVVYTTTTAGTLKLQGALAVSGATNTVLKAGAWMTATPLP